MQLERQASVHVRPRIRKFPVLKLALPVLVRVPVLVWADPRSSTGIAFWFWLLWYLVTVGNHQPPLTTPPVVLDTNSLGIVGWFQGNSCLRLQVECPLTRTGMPRTNRQIPVLELAGPRTRTGMPRTNASSSTGTDKDDREKGAHKSFLAPNGLDCHSSGMTPEIRPENFWHT